MKTFNIIVCCFILLLSSTAQEKDYLGETLPGKAATLFAAGKISTGMDEFNATFTPDYKEFYFSIRNGWNYFAIFKCERKGSEWSAPKKVSFSSDYLDADPFITADGQYLYFCSNRPVSEVDNKHDWNIWRVKRVNNSWGLPELLPFNTEDKNEMYVSVADNGNVYFHADYDSEKTDLDLMAARPYYSVFSDGRYSEPRALGGLIDEQGPEYDPCVSPDESFVIFTANRAGGYGSGDLYISYNKGNNDWTKAVNAGPEINSTAFDYCPNFSPDGKYFFFSSYKPLNTDKPLKSLSYREVYHQLLGSGNGKGDIYWIDAEMINNKVAEAAMGI